MHLVTVKTVQNDMFSIIVRVHQFFSTLFHDSKLNQLTVKTMRHFLDLQVDPMGSTVHQVLDEPSGLRQLHPSQRFFDQVWEKNHGSKPKSQNPMYLPKCHVETPVFLIHGLEPWQKEKLERSPRDWHLQHVFWAYWPKAEKQKRKHNMTWYALHNLRSSSEKRKTWNAGYVSKLFPNLIPMKCRVLPRDQRLLEHQPHISMFFGWQFEGFWSSSFSPNIFVCQRKTSEPPSCHFADVFSTRSLPSIDNLGWVHNPSAVHCPMPHWPRFDMQSPWCTSSSWESAGKSICEHRGFWSFLVALIKPYREKSWLWSGKLMGPWGKNMMLKTVLLTIKSVEQHGKSKSQDGKCK